MRIINTNNLNLVIRYEARRIEWLNCYLNMNQLTSTEEAQLLNEIKATNLDLGLLINFGAPMIFNGLAEFTPRKKLQENQLANPDIKRQALISAD